MYWLHKNLPYIVAGILIVGALVLIVSVVLRRRRLAFALTKTTCLLCDSDQVEILDEDDNYRCQECGFDNRWEQDPVRREPIQQFRDLKHALASLRRGHRKLKSARSIVGAEAQIEEANREIMEGLSGVQALVTAHPELLEGETYSPSSGASDRFGAAAMQQAAASQLNTALALGIGREIASAVEVQQELKGSIQYSAGLVKRLGRVENDLRLWILHTGAR